MKKRLSRFLIIAIFAGVSLICAAETTVLFSAKKNAKWFAGHAPGHPEGKSSVAKINEEKTSLFEFPALNPEFSKGGVYFSHKLSCKKLAKNNCDVLIIVVKAANKESIGQKITVSLNVAPKQRYWASFTLSGTNWTPVPIALFGSPWKGTKNKFSPEIEKESIPKIKGLTILRVPPKKNKKYHSIPKAAFYLKEIIGANSSGADILRILSAKEKPLKKKDKKTSSDSPVSLNNLPVTDDKWTRPESKNGCFYVNGKPVFLTGPNVALHHAYHVKTKKSKALEEATGSDPIYKEQLSAEMCKDLGFKTFQLNPVSQVSRFENDFISKYLSDKLKKLVCWSKWAPEGKKSMGIYGYLQILHEENIKQFKALKGVPFSADFCPTFDSSDDARGRLKDAGLPESALEQVNGWITVADSPWCHADPIGKEIDNSYFKGGAYWLLSLGANPWIYEFWNELHNFNCTCEANQKRFVLYIKGKYGNIQNLNKEWNSSFKSFEEIVAVPNYRADRGLWGDWMKFMGDRWQETILDSESALREVDARPNTYVSWEISNSSVFYPTQGADCYKGAQAVDCFGYEGGVSFGLFPEKEANKATLLTEIVFGYGKHAHKFFSDFCRAVSPDKPIINFEAYAGRTIAGLPGFQPVKRMNFTTSLWSEVIHGVSSSKYYVWWMHPKIDPEKPAKGPHLERSLLNPRTCPRDSLNGIKDFNDEVEKLGDLVLPRPRIKGIIATLFSQPTIWQDPPIRNWLGEKYNIKKKILNTYEALHLSHYPLDVMMEEDFRSGKASQYKAIIVPASEYAYKRSLPEIKKYVSNGGTLIVLGGGLTYDEYGKKINSTELLGVQRKEHPEKIADSFNVEFEPENVKKIETDCFNIFELTSAKPLLITEQTKRPCVTVNKLGKGKVYYIGMESLSSSDLLALYCDILKDANISRPFFLENEDGAFVNRMEAQLIDRGDKKIYYIVNWDWPYSKIIKLFPQGLKGDTFFVTDIIADKVIANNNGGKTWSKEDLSKGIPILAPSQQRTLTMVSTEPWKHEKGIVTFKEAKEKLKNLLLAEKLKKEKIQEKIQVNLELQNKEEEARKKRQLFKDVKREKCFFIDLSKHANMAFADDQEGDHKGGWLDQGNKDLRNFPVGRQLFSNVPFNVIDPAQNNGKSCIMLFSKMRKYYPKKVEGVSVDRKAANLYFMHASGWTGKDLVYKYVVHYKNGDLLEIPICGGKQISDWLRPKEISDAKIGWEGKNPIFKRIGLYVYRWKNPHPEKRISSLDMVSERTQTVPGIVAISVEEP